MQVEGIDESDIVKNDGSYIYSIGGGQLVIVRAHPAEERGVLSRTSLRLGEVAASAELLAAEEALLDGDLLLILSAAQLSTNGRAFAGLVALGLETLRELQVQPPVCVTAGPATSSKL